MKYDLIEKELTEYIENADISRVDDLKMDIENLLQRFGCYLAQLDVNSSHTKVLVIVSELEHVSEDVGQAPVSVAKLYSYEFIIG
jgi:hypothetical protein